MTRSTQSISVNGRKLHPPPSRVSCSHSRTPSTPIGTYEGHTEGPAICCLYYRAVHTQPMLRPCALAMISGDGDNRHASPGFGFRTLGIFPIDRSTMIKQLVFLQFLPNLLILQIFHKIVKRWVESVGLKRHILDIVISSSLDPCDSEAIDVHPKAIIVYTYCLSQATAKRWQIAWERS